MRGFGLSYRHTMKLFLICGALAAGEWAASLHPSACTSWPFFLAVALLAALVCHGLAVRAWYVPATALLGAALYFHAVLPHAETYRLSPWARHCRKRCRPSRPEPVKREVSRRIGIGLDHCRETAAVNRAILLGERRALPRDLGKAFIDAGTVHIFAVSGLHVMVIARTLVVLLMFMLFPQRLAGAVSLIPLWGYVWLVDAPPSAVRAGMMASLDLLAPVFWRRRDSLRSWAITFLTVHLVDPRMITDIGCILSFTVMLSLVLATRAAASFRRRWAEAVFFSAAAWAAGAPIAANVFGRVTPGGALANLALLPAAGVSVSAGALGVMASCVSEKLGAHLNNLSALMTSAMAGISRAVASLPMASFETSPWHPAVCVAWYVSLFAGLVFLRRGSRSRHDGVRSVTPFFPRCF